MAKVRLWGGVVCAVMLAAALVLGQGPARMAEAAETKGGVQLLIDGRQVATFQEVSGLEMERTALEAVCRADGRDDDCDGVATEMWQAEVLTALWQLSAAADELDREMWASSKARHDIAKNAIGNIRARVAQVEGTIQDATQPLKTRHDTVKNAVGNIRAAVRAFTTVTANEEGVSQEQVKAMGTAAQNLQGLADNYQHRYRPGRPVFGNITLRGPVGSLKDTSLLASFRGATERKSGSIIFMDEGGKEVARYNFYEGWPARFASSHLVEEIEFVVERVERAR
jgi:hypothetical protein